VGFPGLTKILQPYPYMRFDANYLR
jgi:hypothetical protein